MTRMVKNAGGYWSRCKRGAQATPSACACGIYGCVVCAEFV